MTNFPITGVPVGHFPEFVRGLALVKQAAARANKRLGYLDATKADAIDRACIKVATEARYAESFVVDAIQGGAGTSTNMNANEVIANVALGLMGRKPGDYAALHPNDDVNMAQSTNDAYPTALRESPGFSGGRLVWLRRPRLGPRPGHNSVPPPRREGCGRLVRAADGG